MPKSTRLAFDPRTNGPRQRNKERGRKRKMWTKGKKKQEKKGGREYSIERVWLAIVKNGEKVYGNIYGADYRKKEREENKNKQHGIRKTKKNENKKKKKKKETTSVDGTECGLVGWWCQAGRGRALADQKRNDSKGSRSYRVG